MNTISRHLKFILVPQCCLWLQAVSLAYSIAFLGISLTFAIIYVWAREIPDQTVTALPPCRAVQAAWDCCAVAALQGHTALAGDAAWNSQRSLQTAAGS